MRKPRPGKPDRAQAGGSYRRERPGAPLELIEQTALPDGAFRPEAPAEAPEEPEIDGDADAGSADANTGQEG